MTELRALDNQEINIYRKDFTRLLHELREAKRLGVPGLQFIETEAGIELRRMTEDEAKEAFGDPPEASEVEAQHPQEAERERSDP